MQLAALDLSEILPFEILAKCWNSNVASVFKAEHFRQGIQRPSKHGSFGVQLKSDHSISGCHWDSNCY